MDENDAIFLFFFIFYVFFSSLSVLIPRRGKNQPHLPQLQRRRIRRVEESFCKNSSFLIYFSNPLLLYLENLQPISATKKIDLFTRLLEL